MLADAVAEGPGEDDSDRDDRPHSGDAGDPERRATTQGLVYGGEQQGAAQDRAEHDGCGGERSSSGRDPADADGGAGLERPERQLRSCYEPAREEGRGWIEIPAGKRDAVPGAEQREAEGRQRSSPEDEPAEQHSHAGRGGDARRPRQLARRQSNGEREDRRADERSDARRYARIALAKRLNADTSSSTGSRGSPKRH